MKRKVPPTRMELLRIRKRQFSIDLPASLVQLPEDQSTRGRLEHVVRMTEIRWVLEKRRHALPRRRTQP